MAPLHVRKELGPDTDYQATRKGLLNEVLKPNIPTNIIQQPFNDVQ